MKKVSYFLSHPIQYQTPLLQRLAKLEGMDLEVVYFTDHTIGGLDTQFGIEVKWDIPLLEGYQYRFLKNYARNPAVSGKFWGLINWGLVGYLIKQKPDTIIVHGWGYFSNIILLLVAKVLNIKIIMRAESPLKQESQKTSLNQSIKNIILLFPSRFLYIGQENKAFYESFGKSASQLFFAPYSVDNERFSAQKQKYTESESIRAELNIPLGNRIGLFCGKFIEKKRPMDILKAYLDANEAHLSIVFIGTGHLELSLKDFVKEHQLKNIHFVGFINQTQLYRYYLSADFFILPSGSGETWGLVTNEAMNYELPLIISDMVGCTADLVIEGENGFTYPCGNTDVLSKKLKLLTNMPIDKLQKMGHKSEALVQKYSYNKTVEGIKRAIFN